MKRKHLSTKTRVSICPPLTASECGRGVQLPPDRLEEIEAGCLAYIREGLSQHQICCLLKASRSRVARWCQSAIRKAGDYTEFRRLKMRTRTEVQRLWSRIDVRGKDDCWPWLGACRENGYGQVVLPTGSTTAHRAVFETFVCDVPADMQIDHRCNNPICVNPAHLQIVRPNENLYFIKSRAAR